MGYVILCYRDERVIDARCSQRERRVGQDLARIVDEQVARGRVTASVRLLATTTSTTLRLVRGAPLVSDGPPFEADGQLQSLYLLDCARLEDALAIADAFARIEPGGVYEVRPIAELKQSKPSGTGHGRD